MARLSLIEQEPKIGRFLNDLVNDRKYIDFYPLDDAAEFDRAPFFFPERPETGIGPFGQHMLNPAFRRYRTDPVAAYEFPDAYVIGNDGVVVTADGVLRNTLEQVSTWHPESLVEQIRRKDYMRLRQMMPVTSFVEDGRYLVGFNGAWRNHGHWLPQCLPKLYAFTLLRRRFRDLKLVLPPLKPGSAPQRTLDLLGIRPEMVHTLAPNAVTGFASVLLLPNFDLWSVSSYVSAAADAVLAGVPADPPGTPARPDKVYLHRTVRARHVSNFAEVAPLLARYGFAVRSFEDMDFAEQVATMRAARFVVAEHGAGTANIMFCAEGARVLELFNPFCVQPAFWSIASRRGLGYGYLVGAHSATETQPVPNWNSAYDVPLDRLEAAIRATLRLEPEVAAISTTTPAAPRPASAPAAVPPAAAAPAATVPNEPHAPAKFGGILEPIFEVSTDLGRLGRGAGYARLPVFGPLLPPPQRPMYREGDMPPDFIGDHYQYPPPQTVAVYAVGGATLWGNGLLTSGSQFVAPTDCLPAYFRGNMRVDSDPLHPSQAGALGRPDVRIVTLDHPVAAALHPNLDHGHFLLEMLPRLYLLAALQALGAGVPLALSKTTPEWAKAFVRLLHPDAKNVWYDGASECVAAPSIVLPSMMHTEHNYHPAINLMVRDLVGSLPPATAATPALLYIKQPQADLKVENDAEIEATVTALGFTVVKPHELGPQALIRLFSGARAIVGEFGSGLYNALFAAPGTRVIAINFASGYQSKIARVRGHRIAYVPPQDGAFRHWRFGRGLSRKFTVDPAVLSRTITDMLEMPA